MELSARPALTTYETIIWDAFGELSTERSIGMSMGPIPWSRILQYARHHGMSVADTDSFIQTMMAVDSTHLRIARKNDADKSK